MFLPRLSCCLVAVLAFLVPRILSAQIHALVEVSGAVTGSFLIDLEYAKAPTTVANFVGLATGQRPWIDYATGAIRTTPYYNGVRFHRVISGFMSQVGSRKGDGTDGPGYVFKDEFDPTLRHDAAYVVSMANSGKHSNGSQFFITASPQAQLNDVHSVFGHVIAGQAIIDAINAISGTPPATATVIESITVSGPSLASLDLFPPTLPTVLDAGPVLTKSGASYSLTYNAGTYSQYTGYHGSDLAAWSLFTSRYSGATLPAGTEDVTAIATGPRHFFRMARIDYSTTAVNDFLPSSVAARNFSFPSGFVFPVQVAIDAAGTGGTWTLTGSASGALHTVTYTPGPFTSQLYLRCNSAAIYGFDLEFLYTLHSTSANGGTYAGRTNVNGYTSISGIFTTTP